MTGAMVVVTVVGASGARSRQNLMVPSQRCLQKSYCVACVVVLYHPET